MANNDIGRERYFDVFECIGDGTQDDGTLFSLASEYLEAATILSKTPSEKISVSTVIFYLLGHASELALKSFLFRKGCSITDIKSIGHNLDELCDEAKRRGLGKEVPLLQIRFLSDSYCSKGLEYRKRTKVEHPNRDELLSEVKSLVGWVFGNLSEDN